MDLKSFFRLKASPAAQADRSDGDADETELRSQARRRLIGAVVLLGIGVIAFPLLFETEPRPIPVDLPIEIPRKDSLPPPAVPAPAATRAASAPIAEASKVAPTSPAAVSPPAPPPPVEQRPASAPVAAKQAEPGNKAAAATTRPADDGTRAKALLEAKPSAVLPASKPADAPRFVVQIGAFAEDRTVRDVRAKVEKLGMATYTQVIQVQAGERTRVRVGPFPKREDADATAEKLKKAGLPASVLTL